MNFFYKSDHAIFFPKINGNDIQVVPKKMRLNSVRNLMCVGRYAEKMQWSEAKWNLFEMPAIDM